MWFGRGQDFGFGSLTNAQLGNRPCVFISSSQDTQNIDSQLTSKREVKKATWEMAINVLMVVGAVDKEERKEQDNAKVSEFLDLLFGDKTQGK